jgi:AcrR family transcriptional regulator
VLDAARELVLTAGTAAATTEAIASASGAPVGTLYHRFGSRHALLGAMWIRAVKRSHETFCAPLDAPDPTEAATGAALSILTFCADHFADAQLLVTLRQRDLLREASAELKKTLEAINEPVIHAMSRLTGRLTGRSRPTARALSVVALATVDLPLGAVRRHLVAGQMPPPAVRAPLDAAVRAALRTLE